MGGFVKWGENMKLCPYCSGEIEAEAKVCTHCGMKIKAKKEKKTSTQESSQNTYEDQLYGAMGLEKVGPLNKLITLLLCVFLGIFGAHKLYEQKYTMALLYLITGGFCGLGVLLDLYLILQRPQTYYVYKQKSN